MTIKSEVLAEFDEWMDFILAEYPSGQKNWQIIRAHLANQDAEIARLNVECEHRMRQAMQNGQAAKAAECRLAAADALLREILPPAHFVLCLPDSLAYRIQSHLLQGAGDE